MCFGGGPTVDNTLPNEMAQEAAQARAEEEARQQRIKDGSAKIDDLFSQFNDAFFNGRKQAYLDYYTPQVNDAYKKGKDELTFALARNGNLNSTAAADKFGDLLKKYNDQQSAIVSQADADLSSAKTNIAGEKSSLLAQLNATGDADRASNDALGRTQELFAQKPVYNPLGDIFAGIANGIGNYGLQQQNTAAYRTYFGSPAANGGSSARVVN